MKKWGIPLKVFQQIYVSLHQKTLKKTIMRKGLLFVLGAALLVSSCSGGAAGGAYAGGQFGYIIGSSIGGIAGGWRGHHTGALIGTVGGMVAGAVIGDAIENSEQRKYEQRSGRSNDRDYDRSYDRSYGPGDDRIIMTPQDPSLEIRNAMVLESLRDGVLTRGEECSVVFEIYNTSDETINNVRPLVEDATGNKHIKISPNLLIESIAPRQGVRYTATILADKRLKDGEIVIRVGVAQGETMVASQTREFRVPTAKARH